MWEVGKTYEDGQGDQILILKTDGLDEEYPIIAMSSKGDPENYTREGYYMQGFTDDLNNLTTREVIPPHWRWYNVYPGGFGAACDTRIEADKKELPHAIGRVKLDVSEFIGRWDDE